VSYIIFEEADVFTEIVNILLQTVPLLFSLPVGVAIWLLLYAFLKKRVNWSTNYLLSFTSVCTALLMAAIAVEFTAYFGVSLREALEHSEFLRELPLKLPFVE